MDSQRINLSPAQGHLSMLLATVFWGAMAPVAKGILEQGVVDGVALSAIRIAGGALLFALAALLPRRITGDMSVAKSDLAQLFLASVIMISANQGLFIIAIEYTTPIDTAVMCTLTPVFTLILAAIFIAQPMTIMKVTGVAIGLGGALIMAFTDSGSAMASNPLLGDSLCMAAQLCAAIYYVFFIRLINKYPPFTIMKWMFLFSALTYVPCTLPFLMDAKWNAMNGASFLSLGYIILFPTFIAYLIIPFAQRLLKPTVISMYAYIQPVVAALVATCLGLAVFGTTRLFATALIFFGVFLVSFNATREKRIATDNNTPHT